jgi:hypothetical protein
MFSTIGFWALFWAEILTTFWISLGGPIDYHLPYPTRFSYLGEHALVWLAFVFIAHLALRPISESPFSMTFASLRTALPSYALVGLFGELGASLLLYRIQSGSPGGVKIWVDPTNPHHVLQSFLAERLATWVVAFPVAFIVAYALKGKQKALNQS